MTKRKRTNNTITKGKRTNNTITKRKRTDNAIAKRKRTNITITKRKRTNIVFFLLVIVLFVLRFTASDYPFGTFKLLLYT
jgi:hypothetical protein